MRILEGILARFEGVVESIDAQRGTAIVVVRLFGRDTPVECALGHLAIPEPTPEPPPGTKRPYCYYVTNMGGCLLGASDYHFECVVYAVTEEGARSWGLHVTKLYSRRFGLPPHNLRVREGEIASNASLWWMPEFESDEARNRVVCNAGELPEVLVSGRERPT